MSELTAENLWTLIETLRRGEVSHKSRTVHCFMNTVAANDCANALLAVGARPVMADCPDECGFITAKAGALVLNMGTFSPEKGRAMLISGKAANDAHIPVIIDPVGVQASPLRKKWFGRLMKELRVSAVKGNTAEMFSLKEVGITVGREEQPGEVLAAVCAEQFGCAVLVTGETDCLSDGKRLVRFANGSPHLAAVTGTGCMTGALIGAFATESDPMAACAAAVSLMNISGELAAEHFRGTGTFRTGLMDWLSQPDRDEFLRRLDMTVSEVQDG